MTHHSALQTQKLLTLWIANDPLNLTVDTLLLPDIDGPLYVEPRTEQMNKTKNGVLAQAEFFIVTAWLLNQHKIKTMAMASLDSGQRVSHEVTLLSLTESLLCQMQPLWKQKAKARRKMPFSSLENRKSPRLKVVEMVARCITVLTLKKRAYASQLDYFCWDRAKTPVSVRGL